MVTAPLGASVAAKCCQTPSDRALGAVTVHAVQVPPSHTAKPKSLEAPFRYITMLSAAAPLPMSKIRSHVVELVWKTHPVGVGGGRGGEGQLGVGVGGGVLLVVGVPGRGHQAVTGEEHGLGYVRGGAQVGGPLHLEALVHAVERPEVDAYAVASHAQ